MFWIIGPLNFKNRQHVRIVRLTFFLGWLSTATGKDQSSRELWLEATINV